MEPRFAQDVLVVDDDPVSLDLVRLHLEQGGYKPLTATTGLRALQVFNECQPRVVVCDWMMPKMDGLEVCRLIRAGEGSPAQAGVLPERLVYFIMLTVHSDKDRLMHAFDEGVDDFLSKPFHAGELLARVRAGCRLVEMYDQVRGQTRMLQQTNGELSRLNEKLRHTATVDSLTHLLNRRQAMVRLHEHWALGERYGQPLTAGIIDVDHFKRVNDTYGHLKGDEVLQSLATVLSGAMRSVDMLFRLGGEEFLMLMPQTNVAAAAVCAERCRRAVYEQVFADPARRERITISVGLAEKRQGMQASDDLLRAADEALYAAKRAGRNRIEVSAPAAAA